ncbi:MAG: AAA family ATPase [Rubripirellula sp.]|jgi:MoxR-like ATPase|nr:MoxR family ATPase [Planctomycetaceae bacterium]MDF1843448.1 MoxR family ATPase [Rubripirellula sp.]
MSSSLSVDNPEAARQAADEFRTVHAAIREEVSRMMVGQDATIDGVLAALFAAGHVLLEGVPGLGKTLLVSSLGKAIHLTFSRIQFTPDMMPADIRGTNVLQENETGGTKLEFQPGPLVANLVLADEINRATPRTQAALLESMQEKQISVGNRTIALEEPFCVMATQNPVEQEGTYPLPEAQLDRFLFKLVVGYPAEEDYRTILRRTTSNNEVALNPVSNAETIIRMRQVVRSVPVPDHVETEAIQLVMATQPGSEYARPLVNEVVSLGASPRGVQSLILAGKVRALLDGRFAVAGEDLKAVAPDVLRHRILVNFHGMSDGVTPDDVIQEVLK